MSNDTNTKAQPTYRIFSVVGEGDKAVWHGIGAAWPHNDGLGFNLDLAALPLPGARLVLRVPKAKGAASEEA